jgi:hypothetical protein
MTKTLRRETDRAGRLCRLHATALTTAVCPANGPPTGRGWLGSKTSQTEVARSEPARAITRLPGAKVAAATV